MKQFSAITGALEQPALFSQASLKFRTAEYWALSKPRVTLLVWMSMLLGMAYGAYGAGGWGTVIGAALGTWLVIASANGLNQVLETDFDAEMNRTMDRPLPSGRLSRGEGLTVSLVWGALSMPVLWFGANPLTAMLGLAAWVAYVFFYTPMKRLSPLCIVPGAFAGAMPPVMGWAAMRGGLGVEAFGLFAIQFLWQFPHTWAIAWLNREDYLRVGFRMLPVLRADGRAIGVFMVLFSLLLMALSLFPFVLGPKGLWYGIGAAALGLWMTGACVRFYRDPSRGMAKKVLLTSVAYLPFILLLAILMK